MAANLSAMREQLVWASPATWGPRAAGDLALRRAHLRLAEAMTRGALSTIAILSLAGTSAAAQCTPGGPKNPLATPRAITGIVMDSSHQVLDNATVRIARPRREARTNANGIFQLRDLDTGIYEVTVRRIGYEVAQQSYTVTDSGGIARFCLFQDIQALPTMISSVSRGGISGVVGDSTLALVKDADVRVLGEDLRALTDSAGGFFFPVKPGAHTITVRKKGYGPQVVGVTVPKDSGRKIVVWLGSPPRNPNTMALAIERMRMTILMTPAFRYHRVTAEELAESELTMEQLVRVKGRTNVRDDCEAWIAGTDFSLPLYMLDKGDISLLEITTAPLSRRRAVGQAGLTSINGNAPIPTQGRGTAATAAAGLHSPDCPSVTAWMKP